MWERAVLSVVGKKKYVHGYRKHYLAASPQNIANHFSLLWCEQISRRGVGDILSEEKTFSVYRHPRVNANIGAGPSVML
jgi:hypothetical protein